MFAHYNNLVSQFIRKQVAQNSDNAMGWTLLLRNPEEFTEIEIVQMSDRFNAVLKFPSTALIQDRIKNIAISRNQQRLSTNFFNHSDRSTKGVCIFLA